jgi:predicted amidohydrolase
MGSWQLRIGAVQLCSTSDLPANLATCRALIERAAAADAQLVVLPERFGFSGRGEGDQIPHAEALDRGGPILDLLRDLGARLGIWIVGGGLPELVPGDARRTYTTAVVVDPRGAIAARYRQIHPLDAGIAAGDELVVVEIAGAKIGLSISDDVRFPELYRRLVKDRGAEVLLVPAAFGAQTGAAHWHLLLRARAIEDQAWVVAAAQWGRHGAERESFGHALVVDPWGTVVGEQASGDGVVMAALDGATVEKRRTQMPCLEHAVLWR